MELVATFFRSCVSIRTKVLNSAGLRRLILLASICTASAVIGGCAGGSAPSGGQASPTPSGPTSVTVSPPSASLGPSQQATFTASVQGTGNFNSTVEWMVDGTLGGNTDAGTITLGGLYTAPATLQGVITVTVSAQSVADPLLSGSSRVTLTPNGPTSVTVSPTSAIAGPSQQVSFTANVQPE